MTTSKLISKSLLLFSFMAITVFTSCKDKETTVDQSTETVQEATLDQKKQMLDNVVPGNSNNANSGNTAGMNPEHGQPGHRCDLPVGAPLSGAPATSPQVTPVQSPASTTPIKVADGLNPPHGQPGHRCDIQVGEPL